MKKCIFLLCMIITVVFLTACGSTEPVQYENPGQDSESNESDITDESETVGEDPFAAVRESNEIWLSYGLAAYEADKKPENLFALFEDMTSMSYLTLYNHWFTYDKETVIPVAEALFRFICDEYGVDALLDTGKRIEYKTAYLQSLGVEYEYIQTPEIENFFLSMELSSDETYEYIMTFDNVTYYFKDFSEGPPALYNQLLYYNTNALWDMIEYLKDNNLDARLNTERHFDYYMTFDVTEPSLTDYNTGNMYINDGASTLHEAVHAMGVYTLNNIWLSEGICNYFSKILCFDDRVTSSTMQIPLMVAAGRYDAREAEGDIVAICAKKVYDRFMAKGGRLESADSFDMRLYNDVLAAIDFEGEYSQSLAAAANSLSEKKYTGVGGELTYNHATSLVAYLVDTYGIDTVMDAYHTQNIEGKFGKDYADLKEEWLEYLEQFTAQ